jgi:hypothetical protein
MAYDQLNAANAYNAMTGLAGGAQDAARYLTPQTDKPNDVEAIYLAMKTASALSEQVRDLVNKIAGVANEAISNGEGPKEASPSGVFPSLGRVARDVTDNMNSAIRALRRLESQLP